MTRPLHNAWRDLHVEQMSSWPDAPRRGLLLALALLALILGFVYRLAPVYIEWQKTVSETHLLQKRYLSAAHAMAVQKHAATIHDTQSVHTARLSSWLVEAAAQAETLGLQGIQMSPIAFSTEQPANDHSRLSQITMTLEGDYLDVVKWWVGLADSPRILSMAQIELIGLDKNRVRGQVSLIFEQEVAP